MGGDSFSVRLGHNRDLMVTLMATRSWLWPSLTKNLFPATVLRILWPFLYQTVALFNVQKVKPIWRAPENFTTRSRLWPSGHNRDLVVISVTIRSWLWPNLTKNLSPPTVLRIFSQFLYQTAVLFNAQKVRPIWRAYDIWYGFWQKNRLDYVKTVT